MILKSINYWSMSGGLEGTLEISNLPGGCQANTDYDAVELCIGESGALGLDTTEARCKEIVAEADGPPWPSYPQARLPASTGLGRSGTLLPPVVPRRSTI